MLPNIFLSDEEPVHLSEIGDDFDHTVSGEQWNRVLDAVKNQREDQLKSRLQEVDDDIRKQGLVGWQNSNSIYACRKAVNILDREQSLGRKEGPPTTRQETKYAHFSLLSSWLRLCINITYIQLNLSNRNR